MILWPKESWTRLSVSFFFRLPEAIEKRCRRKMKDWSFACLSFPRLKTSPWEVPISQRSRSRVHPFVSPVGGCHFLDFFLSFARKWSRDKRRQLPCQEDICLSLGEHFLSGFPLMRKKMKRQTTSWPKTGMRFQNESRIAWSLGSCQWSSLSVVSCNLLTNDSLVVRRLQAV